MSLDNLPSEHQSDETWVPLSRGLRDHLAGMATGCRLALYIYLLIEAKHTGLHKGKVAASFSDLALALGVHYSTLYKAAQWLKEQGYITYEPAKNQWSVTVFTVTKYKNVEDFIPSNAFSRAFSADAKSEVKASKKQGKSKSTKANDSKSLHVLNNDKNENNEDKIDIHQDEFDEFWKSYPRKVGKGDAHRAFEKADVPLDTLLTALEKHKLTDQWRNPKFIPYPSKWLNGRRWEDELEQKPEAKLPESMRRGK